MASGDGDNGVISKISSNPKVVTAFVLGGIVLASSVIALHLGIAPAFPPPLGSRFRKKKKPIRVYMDGCFDMMHYGHCNALRQARALGDELVVGVVSDDEITRNKGPPVTPLDERLEQDELEAELEGLEELEAAELEDELVAPPSKVPAPAMPVPTSSRSEKATREDADELADLQAEMAI